MGIRIDSRDLEVDVWDAHPELDGGADAIVVQIDTGSKTGHLRVNVNEGVIFDGDPEVIDSPKVTLAASIFHRAELLEAAAMQLAIDLGVLRADMAAIAESTGRKL